jgi:hypothetical protein
MDTSLKEAKELGYTNMFGHRETAEAAIEYARQMLSAKQGDFDKLKGLVNGYLLRVKQHATPEQYALVDDYVFPDVEPIADDSDLSDIYFITALQVIINTLALLATSTHTD